MGGKYYLSLTYLGSSPCCGEDICPGPSFSLTLYLSFSYSHQSGSADLEGDLESGARANVLAAAWAAAEVTQ